MPPLLSWKIVPVDNTNTQFLFHVNISPHNSSVLRGLETTCITFTLPKIHFESQVAKMSSLTIGIGKRGPSTYRADVLTIALWCSPQRHKHDISQTCLHLLATHTTQVGLSPLNIVRSFFYFFIFFYSKPRPFRRNSTIEQQCEQWAARILKAALGNVAAGSIQLRRPEVSASTQERRAKYGGGGGEHEGRIGEWGKWGF